jgi:cysteinyl-tRNA synthetase
VSPRPLRLHDTLTRELREVTHGEDGLVRFYTCGPTIHDYPHVGNARLFTWADVARRTLLLFGHRVRFVMNITDVEDKIIERARARGIDVSDPARLPEYTRHFEEAFLADLASLRIRPADANPRATELVPQMVAFVQRLIERGHAYVSEGSVSIASFPNSGRLSHLDAREIHVGARVDADEYVKDDARDFVLWKASKEDEPRWDSPWGPGRPGWHLECSVMAMECLGAETIDLHAGGEDLVFPHHENEIAQSEGATGKEFCRLWVHCAHLRVDGQKMSKSLGNFYTLRDLVEKGHDAATIRYFLASSHYRAPMNLTFEGIDAAKAAVERLNECARALATAQPVEGADDAALRAKLQQAAAEFDDCLADDLNTSGALGALFGVVRDANAALGGGGLSAPALDAARALIDRADSVFAFLPQGGVGVARLVREIGGKPYEVVGVGNVPPSVLQQVIERQEARKAKDFARSDALRDALARDGYVVEDVTGGARVRRA